jgi:transcriptional regulator with XRE-family HTH domain
MYAKMNGEKIQEMRAEKGLSRPELARKAGVAESTLERGQRVRRKTGWKVARVFGIHPREIGRPAPDSLVQRRLMGLE